MKKFIIPVLVFVLINFVNTIPASAATLLKDEVSTTLLKEGVHHAGKYSHSPKVEHYIKNVSPNKQIYVQLYDKDYRLIQAVRLIPKSPEFNLIALNPDFKIAIIGDGVLSLK